MNEDAKSQDPIVRPETPKGEDPARLNDLNSDKPSTDSAKESLPKEAPEPIKQDQGQVRSPRSGRDPGIENKQRNRNDDQPTNPPHKENDGTVWATEEQGPADNAKA